MNSTARPVAEGLGPRLAWHAGLAVRASRWSAAFAAAFGIALPLVMPVSQSWLVAATAGLVAVAAVTLVAAAQAQTPGRPIPRASDGADPVVALEGVGAVEHLAHALARSAVLLAALAVGLWAGGLLALGRA